MELLLRGRQTMNLLIKLHPRMTLLLIGLLMIHLLRMKPLLLRGRHLRLKISCSPTHSKTSLLFCHHLLDEAPGTQTTPIVLNTIP